jgi:hypothetical protein
MVGERREEALLGVLPARRDGFLGSHFRVVEDPWHLLVVYMGDILLDRKVDMGLDLLDHNREGIPLEKGGSLDRAEGDILEGQTVVHLDILREVHQEDNLELSRGDSRLDIADLLEELVDSCMGLMGVHEESEREDYEVMESQQAWCAEKEHQAEEKVLERGSYEEEVYWCLMLGDLLWNWV